MTLLRITGIANFLFGTQLSCCTDVNKFFLDKMGCKRYFRVVVELFHKIIFHIDGGGGVSKTPVSHSRHKNSSNNFTTTNKQLLDSLLPNSGAAFVYQNTVQPHQIIGLMR